MIFLVRTFFELLRPALDPVGDELKLYKRLHRNSQGLPLFEKLMASEICDENAMKHPLFKGPFANCTRCGNHKNEAPKFRVYQAMIGVRFRFDRVEGMAVNSTLLL